MQPTIIEQIKLFFTHPVFLAGVFSWLGAQFIKTFINLIYGRVHSFYELLEWMIWRTGGMPSSHSALVTSICVTVGFRNGFHSDLFMLAFALMLIVIRDAFGVRRSSGNQAKAINKIGKELKEKGLLEGFDSVKEVDGHTPMQVILGCCLGFVVGMAFSLL
ncbi:MAG: divergent PAP2 family protein [Treponema sp.]|nr:divergent PAP2 family protein [Treponema sp.]